MEKQLFLSMRKYKQNLKVSTDGIRFEKIYSYGTEVATIDHAQQIVNVETWYSQTTSKHINHVADELGYKVKRWYLNS